MRAYILILRMIILFSCLLIPNLANAKTWYIGVLAPRGDEMANQKWSPWQKSLSKRWKNEQFILVPLSLENLGNVANDHKLDFILAPQTSFLSLQKKIHLRWLANLEKNSFSSISSSEEVGTTIWVNTDSTIQNIKDLKYKKIAAVNPKAFGGYLMGYKLLKDANLREGKDYQVQFTDYPIDQVLTQLNAHQVDAAIAPVCLMEEMQAQGLIKQQDFRALHPTHEYERCISSSPLLPSWTLAALPSVPNSFAKEMTNFLLQTQPAHLPQWTLPVTSREAEDILRSIYKHPDQMNIWQVAKLWIRDNYWIMGSVLITLILLLLNTAWMSVLAHRRQKKLKSAYQRVREYEELMLQTDRINLLGEMTSGIAHEINQPLAVIQSYAEGSLIRLQPIPETQSIQQAQEKIIEQIQRSVEIIHNLRSFVKPKPEFSVQQCQIHQLVQQCISFFHIQYSKDPIVIQNNINQDCIANTVPSIIEQVLMNCLLNSKQQGANVVSIHSDCDQSDHFLKIDILDDAGGFSQERLSFPFEPFKSSKNTGLGLGLVICERLLNSIGGQLHLSNRHDGIKGAKVSLWLPEKTATKQNN